MKQLVLLTIILSLSFCKSINPQDKIVQQSENKEQGHIIREKVEIIPRQVIHITKDEAGADYVKLLPGDKTVFRFQYRKMPEDISLKDAVYTQYIYFEIPGKIKNAKYTDDELKQVNMIAQVSGFRNIQFYRIDKGSLQIKVIDKQHVEVKIDLDNKYKRIQKKHIKQLINIQ